MSCYGSSVFGFVTCLLTMRLGSSRLQANHNYSAVINFAPLWLEALPEGQGARLGGLNHPGGSELGVKAVLLGSLYNLLSACLDLVLSPWALLHITQTLLSPASYP